MFDGLTNRLNKLEAARPGRECTCPPPKPATLRPGCREVDRREVSLGVWACPDCGGLRNLVIVQVAIVEGRC
jgi:hypothetical protein